MTIPDTSKDEAYQRIVLLIPEPFFRAWTHLVGLSQTITQNDCKPEIPARWPILALTIKAAHTTLSIATLAAMRQWPDAAVLGRSLFETEMLVKWMLESDTESRVATYLSEIEMEAARLRRKMAEGRSVSAQILRDIVPHDAFKASTPAETDAARVLGAVRDRARATNLDRSYDLTYWVASVFAHSQALSLSQWNPEMLAADSPFISMFKTDGTGLACGMVLGGIPMSALDTFQVASHHFGLGVEDRIATTRQEFREAGRKFLGGSMKFTKNIRRGDVIVERDDGTTTTYSPKRTGRDPVDDLF
jgi:hypothetical protein